MNVTAGDGLSLASRWLAILIILAWLLPGLLGHEPWKPDEAYTFGLVRHIVDSGDWVVPTLAGQPFMEKPPLYFLVAAFNTRLFEGWLSSPDAARLTSAWFLAATLLFVGLAARRLNGEGSGWHAVLLFIAILGLVVRAHQLLTDIAMLSGIALAFLGLTLLRDRRWLGGLALGTGAGVAFLSKGVLGPGLIGCGTLALLLHPAWRRREVWLGLVAALFAALPWLLIWPWALYQRSPELFEQWFLVNNIGRFIGSVHLGPHATPLFYPRLLLWAALPVWPLAVYGMWHVGWRAVLREPRFYLPLSQFLVWLSVLSMAHDARALYALPLYVPLAVLAVPGLRALPSMTARRIDLGVALFFTPLIVLVWLAWGVALSGWPPMLYAWLSQRHPLEVVAADWHILLPAMAMSGLWWWLIGDRRAGGRLREALLPAAGLATLWLLVMTLLLPVIDAEKSYRSMCRDLGAALPRHYHCISGVLLGEPQRALFDYYLGLRPRLCPPSRLDERCELVLVQEQDLPAGRHADFGTLIWRGHRPGDERERYALYRLNGAGSASD